MRKRNFYSLITFALVGFLFAGCASKAESLPAAAETEPVAELLRQADEHFRQREDTDKLRLAIGFLKRARSAEETNFEAAWKLAQYSYFLGKATNDDKEAEKVFASGTSAGRAATNIAPDRPEGWFWLGAAHGGEAERFPFTKGLGNVDKIREAMNKVIEIDPNYQGAAAYDALARIELKTASFGGKPEAAVEFLEKGLALKPDNFLSRLSLAEAYVALKRKPEAKQQLEYILKLKPPAELEPEYREISVKARKMLETKF